MIKTSLQIANLMSNSDLSAAEMTHNLKILGNGNMQNGFKRIGCYFSKEIMEAAINGVKIGRRQGFILGASSAIVIGGVSVYIINKKRKDESLEKEGQEILNTMQQKTLSDDNKSDYSHQESE